MPLLRLFVRPIRVGDHMCLTGDTAPFFRQECASSPQAARRDEATGVSETQSRLGQSKAGRLRQERRTRRNHKAGFQGEGGVAGAERRRDAFGVGAAVRRPRQSDHAMAGSALLSGANNDIRLSAADRPSRLPTPWMNQELEACSRDVIPTCDGNAVLYRQSVNDGCRLSHDHVTKPGQRQRPSPEVSASVSVQRLRSLAQ